MVLTVTMTRIIEDSRLPKYLIITFYPSGKPKGLNMRGCSLGPLCYFGVQIGHLYQQLAQQHNLLSNYLVCLYKVLSTLLGVEIPFPTLGLLENQRQSYYNMKG